MGGRRAADGSLRPPPTRCEVCTERFGSVERKRSYGIERFETFDALRARVREFAHTHNQAWLLERHAYRTPAQAREQLLARVLPREV